MMLKLSNLKHALRKHLQLRPDHYGGQDGLTDAEVVALNAAIVAGTVVPGKSATLLRASDGATWRFNGTAFVAGVEGGGTIPTTFGKTRSAIAKVRANAGDMLLVAIGDSTYAGQGAGSGAARLSGAKALSVPSRLAARLRAGGVPASDDSFFGDQRVDQTTNLPANVVLYNPSLTVGAGWSLQSLLSLGGRVWRNDSTTNAISLTASQIFDVIDVYYIKANGNAQFTVDVGGASLGTIDSAQAATAFAKSTISTGAAPAAGVVNIKRLSGTALQLIGVVLRNSLQSRVHVVNLGWCGARAAHYADVTGAWSPARTLGLLGAQAYSVRLGLNDINAQTQVGAYIESMSTVIDACATAGDVFVEMPPVQDPSVRDPGSLTGAYRAALADLARAKSCEIIDTTASQVDFTTASALGFMADSVHQLPSGYEDQVNVLILPLRSRGA